MPLRLLIIGAGPAGAAAAIFATQLGGKVTLLDRRSDLFAIDDNTPPKVGESLPPSVQPVLQELGVWQEFLADVHLPTYGIRSYWGHDRAVHRDYLAHPLGHGWHLDRRRFEQMLLRRVQSAGVAMVSGGTLQRVTFRDEVWQVTWQTASGSSTEADFDFIIDASGRNAYLARQLGVDRLYEHQQLALIRFLTTTANFSDTTGLVETTSDGWWYSSQIPGDGLATAFFCRPEKQNRQTWTTDAGWNALLTKAPATSKRIIPTTTPQSDPYFVAADSSILEKCYGPAWLAIGDAALTLDPVSSHGITLALVTARDAIKALSQQQAGRSDAFAAYQGLLTATFYQYAQQRRQLYQSEKRFPASAYWR